MTQKLALTLMLGGLQAGAATFAIAQSSWAAETLPKMFVTRDPTCGCCGAWVAHIEAAGFPVEVIEAIDLAPIKARLGVPQTLIACHTAQIDGYAIEGHVPAGAIKRRCAVLQHGRAQYLCVARLAAHDIR